jgi:hypothetical protein
MDRNICISSILGAVDRLKPQRLRADPELFSLAGVRGGFPKNDLA